MFVGIMSEEWGYGCREGDMYCELILRMIGKIQWT